MFVISFFLLNTENFVEKSPPKLPEIENAKLQNIVRQNSVAWFHVVKISNRSESLKPTRVPKHCPIWSTASPMLMAYGFTECCSHSESQNADSLRTCIVRGPWCREHGAARATPGEQVVTACGCL